MRVGRTVLQLLGWALVSDYWNTEKRGRAWQQMKQRKYTYSLEPVHELWGRVFGA